MAKDTVSKPTDLVNKPTDIAPPVTPDKALVVPEYNQAPMGFEDEEAGDMIIPRVKVIQTLSPERKDKIAAEGDIINSLTHAKLNGCNFIPVFKFNNNIEWKPRIEGGGIICIARDGKVGVCSDGTTRLCKECKRNEFDNTKTGKESQPKCTKYINFFGFFEGDIIPVILSFSKTNYGEGKKLYSLAKVTMQNMWNYAYVINEKLVAKNGNEWFIINTSVTGPTNSVDRAHALKMFKQYRDTSVKFDLDDTTEEASPTISTETTDNTEY